MPHWVSVGFYLKPEAFQFTLYMQTQPFTGALCLLFHWEDLWYL